MATDRIDTAASEGTESLGKQSCFNTENKYPNKRHDLTGPQSSATAEQYSYGEVHSHLNAEHEASYGNLNMSEAPASHDNDQSNSVRKRPLQSSSPCEQNSLSEPDSPELRPMSNKRVKYVRSASDVSEDQDPHGGVNIVTRAGETYEMQERELDTGSEESRNSTGQSLPGESESSGESDESDDSDNSKESHQSDESDDTRTPPALPPYNDSSDDHSDTHPHDDFNSSSEWDHDSEGNRMPWGSCILRPEERPGYESSHATSDEDSAAESISASEHASDDMSEAGVSIYASLIQLDIPRYSSTRQAFTSSATSSPHLQMSPSMGYGSPERAVFSSPIFAFPPEDEILGDESSRRSSPGRTHEEFRALSDMMDEEVGIDMIQGVRHQQTNIDLSNGSNEDDQAMRGPIGGTASSEQVEMDAEERGDTLHRMEKGYARRHNADRGANVEVFNASDPWPRQYHTPIKGKANLLQYKLAMPDIDEVASGFTPFAAKVTKNPKLMVIPKFKSDTKSNIEFDKEGGRDYGGTESDSVRCHGINCTMAQSTDVNVGRRERRLRYLERRRRRMLCK